MLVTSNQLSTQFQHRVPQVLARWKKNAASTNLLEILRENIKQIWKMLVYSNKLIQKATANIKLFLNGDYFTLKKSTIFINIHTCVYCAIKSVHPALFQLDSIMYGGSKLKKCILSVNARQVMIKKDFGMDFPEQLWKNHILIVLVVLPSPSTKTCFY